MKYKVKVHIFIFSHVVIVVASQSWWSLDYHHPPTDHHLTSESFCHKDKAKGKKFPSYYVLKIRVITKWGFRGLFMDPGDLSWHGQVVAHG